MGERKACKRFGGYAECGHDCRRCGFAKAEMERRKKLKLERDEKTGLWRKIIRGGE